MTQGAEVSFTGPQHHDFQSYPIDHQEPSGLDEPHIRMHGCKLRRDLVHSLSLDTPRSQHK